MVEEKKQPLTPLKSILAGGTAGGLEVLCTFPTEYVKTQLQLDQKSLNPRYTGPVDCVKKTIKGYGFGGLYRGLSSLLYGSIPKSAIRFTVYDACRSRVVEPGGRPTKIQSFVCGMAAGISEAVAIVCPMEAIKVIMINDQTSPNPKYKGFLRGVSGIINDHGIGVIYRGLVPTIIKQGTNQAVRFLTFDSLKQALQDSHPDRDLNIGETFLIGFIAGTISVYANMPIDVVKTRLQGLESHRYAGTVDCIKKILKQEGPRAFYQGTVPRLCRVSFDAAFQFTIYQQVMKFLNWAF